MWAHFFDDNIIGGKRLSKRGLQRCDGDVNRLAALGIIYYL
jgi:hypothetical protein